MAWDALDLENGTIHLREIKTGVERCVRAQAQQAIKFLKVVCITSGNYLFPRRHLRSQFKISN